MKKVKRIQILVPEPCTQRWDEMIPAHGGRHCTSCAKTVTDFTGMTDRELFDFFSKGKVGCGRFYSTQLERIIAAPPAPAKQHWVMRFALALSLLLNTGRLAAQRKSAAPVSSPKPHIYYRPVEATDEDNYRCIIRISGRVQAASGGSIKGVRVAFNEQIVAYTDAEGHYLLKIPGELALPWSRISFKENSYEDTCYLLMPEDIAAESAIMDVHMTMPKPMPVREEAFVQGGVISYRYADDWAIEALEPCLAAEHRFADYKRTGKGFSPVVIHLPSLRFVGHFFSQMFRGRKRTDKNT